MVKNHWFLGVNRKGKRNRQSIEEFKVLKLFFYDTALMDTCHYTWVKTHRMYNTRSENVSNGLWVLADVGSSVVTTMPLWGGMSIAGGYVNGGR